MVLGERMAYLRNVADARGTVDLQEVFHEITTRLMGKMAYNMEMHTDDPFTTAFDYASGATAERFQNPMWFVTELFTGWRFRRSVKVVREFGQKIVAKAVADRHRGEYANGKVGEVSESESKLDETSGTLINTLLDTIPSHQVVADAALNYLSAGRDTTAQALTWTFHLLFRNPDAMEKIRKEALEVLDSASEDRGDPLQLFTPQALPYTLAAFYETLRLYPPIPLEIKQLVSDHAVTLPDGTELPPQAVVVWCPWALGRSLRTWGPDADVFRPERWIVEVEGKKTVAQRPASEFPVFNGGHRSCLGKKMAEVMGVMIIAALAVGFEFEEVEKVVERRSKISLTLPVEGGLRVFVRRTGS
jgi:cytochrome P450